MYYDEVLLCHADLTEGTLSIPASSISIIGHGSVVNENLTIEEESDELVSGEGVGDVEGSDLLNSRALQNGLMILVFIMLALLIRTIREVR